MAIVLVNPAGNTPQGIFAVTNSLLQLGVSAAGAYQLMNGQVVTDPEDRAKVAAVVASALAGPGAAQTGKINVGMGDGSVRFVG